MASIAKRTGRFGCGDGISTVGVAASRDEEGRSAPCLNAPAFQVSGEPILAQLRADAQAPAIPTPLALGVRRQRLTGCGNGGRAPSLGGAVTHRIGLAERRRRGEPLDELDGVGDPNRSI